MKGDEVKGDEAVTGRVVAGCTVSSLLSVRELTRRSTCTYVASPHLFMRPSWYLDTQAHSYRDVAGLRLGNRKELRVHHLELLCLAKDWGRWVARPLGN